MRTNRSPRWHGPPLALQIMALLIGGLLVAQLVTLVLTLALPPAPMPQYGLGDIAEALLDQGLEGRNEAGLRRVVQAGPPDVSGAGWLISERSRRDLAGLIGVDPARVSLAFYTPLPFAGTATMRSVAMANDGYARPLRDDPADADGGRLELAQFQPPVLPGGGRTLGLTPPPRDSLPPGTLARGGPPGQRTAPVLPQVALPRIERERPLITVDPRAFDRNGLVIPGDGGAAVPQLLRGQSSGLGQAEASAATDLAARAVQRAELVPQLAPQSGGLVSVGPGAPFGPTAGPIRGLFPERATMAPIVSVPPAMLAPPALPSTAQTPRAPLIFAPPPPPRVALESALPPPPPPLAPAPTLAPAGSFDEPAGPPIAVASPRRALFGLAPAPFVQGDFVAALRLRDGRWAVVQPAPEPFPNAWQRRVLLWFAIALALVAPLGWLFARRLVKPLGAFAGAAEQLGRDPAAVIGPLDGPAEIGRAARAFNLMQGRLRAFVGDRTAMVGAISHDLRTPLTRMRFRIEDVPDDVREGLLEEVDDMEAMITQVIEFIRDASAPGARERLDLNTLVEDVAENARLIGGEVVVEQADRAPVEVDLLGMRRLLDNLLENAVKYGSRARVRVHADDGEAVAEIIDAGPGLPEDELERAFEPFYRGEEARASDKSGSGLGLAVCRSIARAHGGDIRLIRGEDGFRAELRLPLAFGGNAPLVA